MKRPSFDSETVEQGGQQLDDLCIARGRFASRTGWSNDFSSYLVELAIASLLWTLAAKLRADVEELVQPAIPELVLDIGANRAGGVFGTKCERLAFIALRASLIEPRVHFLRNNVRILAHAACEQLRVFKNGRADFVEVVSAEHIAHCRLNKVPQRRLRRE